MLSPSPASSLQMFRMSAGPCCSRTSPGSVKTILRHRTTSSDSVALGFGMGMGSRLFLTCPQSHRTMSSLSSTYTVFLSEFSFWERCYSLYPFDPSLLPFTWIIRLVLWTSNSQIVVSKLAASSPEAWKCTFLGSDPDQNLCGAWTRNLHIANCWAILMYTEVQAPLL